VPPHDDKFRSRKWQLSAGTQVFSTIALVFGWLDGADYSAITQANIVAYSFANAAEYFTDVKKAQAEAELFSQEPKKGTDESWDPEDDEKPQ